MVMLWRHKPIHLPPIHTLGTGRLPSHPPPIPTPGMGRLPPRQLPIPMRGTAKNLNQTQQSQTRRLRLKNW